MKLIANIIQAVSYWHSKSHPVTFLGKACVQQKVNAHTFLQCEKKNNNKSLISPLSMIHAGPPNY